MALVNTCREVGIPVAVIQEFMEKLADADSQGEATALFEDLLNNRKRELTADLSTMRRQMQQISNLLAPDDDDDTVQTSPLPEDTIILTDIERKCLELMAEGYASVRLARAVGLRTEELQKIETGIIQKFSANNRFQAVAKAVLLGIIPA
jgi:DNA-binding CsgD family transcriptional regulator